MTNLSQIINFSGDDAFYRQPNFHEINNREISDSEPPSPPVLTINSGENRWLSRALSIVKLPYSLLQSGAMIPLLPAQYPIITNYYPENFRRHLLHSEDHPSGWIVKRIAIKIDELLIDAFIKGTSSTFEEKNWVVVSTGNGELAECYAAAVSELETLAKKINANLLFFNYPGVGGSRGPANVGSLGKAYHAVLSFIESQGAKAIIGYGHSLGAAVQAEGLKQHRLVEGISYLMIKSRTFGSIQEVAGRFLFDNPNVMFPLRLLNANFACTASSLALECPEIVLQTGVIRGYRELTSLEEGSYIAENDPVIAREETLSIKLLEKKEEWRGKKRIYAIPESHDSGFPSIPFLEKVIRRELPEIYPDSPG